MREIVSPLDGFASPFGPQRGFNPLRIFANDEPGVWFEANDSTTLFTDVAGTTPVTTPGDAVALQLDKSQGLTLGADISGDAVGASFAGPVATLDGDTWTVVRNADGTISQKVDIEVTGRYEINFTVLADGTETSNLFLLNDNTGDIGFGVNGPGTYTARPSFSSRITWRPNGNASFKLIINSVRELPGNHRTQATTAARPLYALHPVGGVRNLLQYTEEFDNAVWITGTNANSTRSDGSITINTSGGYGYVRQQIPLDGTNTASFDVVSDIDATNVGIRFADNAGGSATVVDFVAGVSQRIVLTRTSSSSTFGEIGVDMRSGVVPGVSSDSGFTITFNRAQLEQSSTATNYQRVGSFLDVSEEGKARRGRIWYNGTSHFMETGTITPGTDKVQVFAGVRKLSDAASAVLAETSTSIASNNGAVNVQAPGATGVGEYRLNTKGTLQTAAASSGRPDTAVIAGVADISGDNAILRVNGTQVNQSTADQGTGNYLAYPLYFGARGGTSLFFNGYEDTSIIRFGPNLDDTTISKVESYVASKTPEPTL